VSARLRGHALALTALGIAIAALYGRVLGYQFVQYDDHELLVLQYGELVKPGNLANVFWRDAFAVLGPEAHGAFYRPLLIADYAIELHVAGPSPAFFHASNLALHAIASGFAYALFVAFGAAIPLALGLALIFAVHPANALIAAWVPCRNESLLAIACIGSALALLGYLRSGRRTALALCVAAYAVALFAKESAIALLPVLAAIAAIERTGRAGEARALENAGRAALAVTIGWAALRHLTLGRSPIGVGEPLVKLFQLVVYLGKALFPVGLAPVPHPADTPVWPGVAAIALLALAAFAMRNRLRGRAGLGLLWCAAFLAPSLSVHTQTWGLEHRLYLPLIGLLLFASAFTLPASLRAPGWLGTAVAFAAALGFAVVTARRLPDFAGPIAYWESAARHAPHSAFAASRVAWRYYEARRFAEVKEPATRALALDPENSEMYLARGIASARLGDLIRAERDLRRATELQPENADAWTNLARAQQLLDLPAQAAESKQRAAELGAQKSD
jgi:tetratricopeptide (TPR) repeat protein